MKKRLTAGVILFAIVLAILGLAWFNIFRRASPQPAWINTTAQTRYFYGSVQPDKTPGIPYWVWLAMPRMFPEHMPGPGGYAALGLGWEEGREMPVGFAKVRVGYIRVAGNCALCHVMNQPTTPGQAPRILNAVSGKANDLAPLMNFLRQCAADPRFNADEFLSEIDDDTKLSLWEKLVYRYVLIPRARKALGDDPAAVLFGPMIRAHLQNPQSETPFTDPQMRELREYVRSQMQSPAGASHASLSTPDRH